MRSGVLLKDFAIRGKAFVGAVPLTSMYIMDRICVCGLLRFVNPASFQLRRLRRDRC
jgi:hypothetical protein